MPSLELSIIINNFSDILLLLKDLSEQTIAPEKIYIIGSLENEIMLSFSNLNIELKPYNSQQNQYIASILNDILSNTKSDYFIVIDSGTRLDNNAIEVFLSKMRHGVLGVCSSYNFFDTVFLGGRWLSSISIGLNNDIPNSKLNYYLGNSLYNVEILKKIGGFKPFAFDSFYIDPTYIANGYIYEKIPEKPIQYTASFDDTKTAVDFYWRNTVASRYYNYNFNELSKSSLIEYVINSNFTTALESIQYLFKIRKYHLLYPAVLSLYRCVIKDILSIQLLSNNSHSLIFYIVKALVIKLVNLYNDEYIARCLVEDLADLQSFVSDIFLSIKNVDLKGESFLSDNVELLSSFYEIDRNINLFFQKLFEETGIGQKMLYASIYRDRWEQENRALIKDSDFKVLLVNTPWKTSEGRLGVRSGSRWPFTMVHNNCDVDIPNYCPFPFFLAYTASYLKAQKITSLVLDCIAEGISNDQLFALVAGYAPTLIVMETSTASIDMDLDYANILKDLCPNSYICFTGSHASIKGRELLEENKQIDFILNGEMEIGVYELSKLLSNKSNDFPSVSGLSYRLYDTDSADDASGVDGRIVVSLLKATAPDFGNLPWPERLMLPMYNYDDRPVSAMEWPCLQLTASRGCPYRCTFCLWPQVIFNGTSVRYRTRSATDVANEIRWAVDMYGYKSFYLDDDTFNIGKRRMFEFSEAIKNNSLESIPWMGMARSDHSDYETLSSLKSAGMVAIKYGVESGVQQLVMDIQKNLDLSTVETSVRNCKELGIQVHLTYSVGLPGETFASIRETFIHALKIAPDSIQLSMMTPFPGTKLYDDVLAKGQLQSHSWKDFDGMASTVTITESLNREELLDRHKLFSSLWLRFAKKVPQELSEEIAMYTGSLLEEVSNYLTNKTTLLKMPITGDSFKSIIDKRWPDDIILILLESIPQTDFIAVYNEPLANFFVKLYNKWRKKFTYISNNKDNMDFVRFKFICNRVYADTFDDINDSPNVTATNHSLYNVFIANAPLLVEELISINKVLHKGGIMMQVFSKSATSTVSSVDNILSDLDCANFSTLDMLDIGSYFIIISQKT